MSFPRLPLTPPVPTVPQNVLVRSDLDQTRLIVSWNAVDTAVRYNVYRGLSQSMSNVRLVSVDDVLVTAEEIVRGADEVGADVLAAADVFAILRVTLDQPGSILPTEDFLNGVDYVLIGNKVDWRTRNRQPLAGQHYFVDYLRRDPKPVLAPLTFLIDPHAHGRIRTDYWYSVEAVFADGSISQRSAPVTLVFVASDRNTREGNKTLERF